MTAMTPLPTPSADLRAHLEQQLREEIEARLSHVRTYADIAILNLDVRNDGGLKNAAKCCRANLIGALKALTMLCPPKPEVEQ
jgi:hypothetical protein